MCPRDFPKALSGRSYRPSPLRILGKILRWAGTVFVLLVKSMGLLVNYSISLAKKHNFASWSVFYIFKSECVLVYLL